MIALFTDGACSGNPGPGGWACVAATPDGRAFELAGGEALTTNNRMELAGVIAGLEAVRDFRGPAIVHSDSIYVISGITEWIGGWKRRGWRTAGNEPVKNEDLWRKLDALVSARGKGGVQWRWVKGHSGHDANERCDELAVALSRRRPVTLYEGPLISYPHGSLAFLEAAAPPKRSSDRRRAAETGPVSYLSLLEGRLETHATWQECEARVKGRSGARFKKVRSEAEAAAVKKSWGL
ncbi:MAG: ribonuclease HI [Elusimicrobia bacterium]|nr:ribonuclease HI [Elusimicrobiota bacterium]